MLALKAGLTAEGTEGRTANLWVGASSRSRSAPQARPALQAGIAGRSRLLPMFGHIAPDRGSVGRSELPLAIRAASAAGLAGRNRRQEPAPTHVWSYRTGPRVCG